MTRFHEQLTVEDARIEGVQLKNKDGRMMTRIKVKGNCTPELASLLRCRDVIYQAGDLPRRSFEQVALLGGCELFSAHLEVDGLRQAVQLHGEAVTDLVIEKEDDLTLNVSFRLNCSGDPLPLVNYWLLVGAAAGICTVTPLQAQLLSDNTSISVQSESGGKQVH